MFTNVELQVISASKRLASLLFLYNFSWSKIPKFGNGNQNLYSDGL